jgi:hypothetical protein
MQICSEIPLYNLASGPSTSTHGKQMIFHVSELIGDKMNKIYRTGNLRKVIYNSPTITDVDIWTQ